MLNWSSDFTVEKVLFILRNGGLIGQYSRTWRQFYIGRMRTLSVGTVAQITDFTIVNVLCKSSIYLRSKVNVNSGAPDV